MRVVNSIGIIIVTYGHEAVINDLLSMLGSQKRPGDKIVVVDNHPSHKSAQISSKNKATDYVVEATNNGFSAGCNIGAEKVIGEVELLFFINPDTRPAPDVLDEMRKGAKTEYEAWMALLTLPDGKVNSAGTVVHISGLAWAGNYGESINTYNSNRDISSLSGACMMVRTATWQRLRGMDDTYFMYCEDTDFSSRIIISGSKLGLLPKAHVEHDYEFDKGSYKWLYLERNRPLYILRTWPAPVIAVLLPILLMSEVGLVLVSILQKRFKLKAHSLFQELKLLPWAFRTRLKIQRTRTISAYMFLQSLEPSLNSPFLGKIAQSKAINTSFVAYYKLALGILRFFSL